MTWENSLSLEDSFPGPPEAANDVSPVGEAVLDSHSRIVSANRTLCSWLDRETQDCRGLPLARFVAPDDTRIVARHIQECFRSAGPVSAEVTLASAGDRHVHLVSVSVGKDTCRTVLTDITDRRRRERALELLADAGTILASPVDCSAMLGRIATLAVCRFASHVALHMVAPGGDDLRCVARAADDGLPPLDSAGVDALAKATLHQARPVVLAGPAADELGQRPLNVLCVPLVAHGDVLGTLLLAVEGRAFTRGETTVAEDLASRIALAVDQSLLIAFLEDARNSNEEARVTAETTARAKGDVLVHVAHELRAPLAAMSVWLDVLRRLPGTEAAVSAIEESIRMQSGMVDDLADLSRSMSARLPLNAEIVDPGGVAKSVVGIMRAQFEAQSIQLDVTFDGAPHQVVGDPRRLSQILVNLLSNSLKFTPAGGRVEVALTGSATDVCLSVSDDGRGIRTDDLPHVFAAFRQGEDGGHRRSGLGLGLAIVRQLVEAHGGSVTAESAGPGLGSQFRLSLPLASGFEVSAATDGQWSFASARVLVAGDDQARVGTLVRLLRAYGSRATSTASAVLPGMIRRQPSDLVVLDVALPEEARDVARRVHAMPGCERLPILELCDGPPVVDTAVASLSRPLNVQAVLNTVERCLRSLR